MNFFKSVFSDEPEDSNPSNSPTESSEPKPSSPSSNPNPSDNPERSSTTGGWIFSSTLFKTLASKSENYRRELEDFGSGLKKETAVIREVASRAVKELPASLDAGAEVAQRSLESVGGAVDNLGSAVTRMIITQGKGSFFAGESYSENNDTKCSSSISISENSKPYNRIDSQISAIQREMNTYCEEPGNLDEYNQWKLGFRLEEKANEIDQLMKENHVIKEIYNEIVPNVIDHEIFWSRYLYKVYKIKKAEEVRSQLVKRAISGEDEEELKWDIDEDDYEDYNESKSSSKLSGGDIGVKVSDKGCISDGNDNGGSSKDSDFSVISSQDLPREEEEEIGWDEIEKIGSSDEYKLDVTDLRRQISVAEEESEELTWDVEDDDDHK